MRVAVLIAFFVIGGCIGTSPEEAEKQAQGSYDDDGDEEHRPGQPCLVCHREGYSPGDDVFAIAGTIFLRATDDDEDGLRDAEVVVTDALDREFRALTNKAGNFMVKVKEGRDTRQKDEGKLEIGYQPEYPLRVKVVFGTDEVEMQSLIWRDGSCAGCHRGETATASSVEKVFVRVN